jgi:DNA repair exonuclease SbcCD ATPase subunit
MFRIKALTVKNFMSVGNATQALSFDRKDLTLVLGENLDLGGDDSGARNGTGKTTIINALSYALFGQALTNIKRDNLINKTNGKNMLVTIEFELDGTDYKIERGRKYNVLKFYIGGHEQEAKDDNSQGDSRETQAQIERLIGMSHDMFKHIVALNTYTEPFLSLRVGDQRIIIEQLLGITLLSEKADALKEQVRITKDSIQAEEYHIKAVIDANKRIEEQIESLKRRQKVWNAKHREDVTKLQTAVDELLTIDIDDEIRAHKDLAAYKQRLKDMDDVDRTILSCKTEMAKSEKLGLKLKKEIESLENHQCYACGQAFHDEKHDQVLADKWAAAREAAIQYMSDEGQLRDLMALKEELGSVGAKPTTYYELEEEAIHHRSSVTNLQDQLAAKMKEEDPYAEQIDEMAKTALVEIDYTTLNELGKLKEHQDFLLKLLTNKDSFIRKRIIDQNLSYLNARLGQYLDRIGLPHTVTFQNDLSVNISELGRELDFDNLSRGERNRLILSLSWAFRDVWESLYHPINLLFIDELIDSGLDTSGVENSLGILKKMSRDGNKSVWLVSHRDELIGRVNNIMRVVKENGYTNYDSSDCP